MTATLPQIGPSALLIVDGEETTWWQFRHDNRDFTGLDDIEARLLAHGEITTGGGAVAQTTIRLTDKLVCDDVFEVEAVATDTPNIKHYWDGFGFTSDRKRSEFFYSRRDAKSALLIAKDKFGKDAAEAAGAPWHMRNFKVINAVV